MFSKINDVATFVTQKNIIGLEITSFLSQYVKGHLLSHVR